jgi:hypothetical protein
MSSVERATDKRDVDTHHGVILGGIPVATRTIGSK